MRKFTPVHAQILVLCLLLLVPSALAASSRAPGTVLTIATTATAPLSTPIPTPTISASADQPIPETQTANAPTISNPPVTVAPVISPNPMGSEEPAVSIAASPTPVPKAYIYKNEELRELQRTLNLNGYLPALKAQDVMTGQMDEPTKDAILRYLATWYADPTWTRNFLTDKEYRELISLSAHSGLPTPSVAPTPSPTPEPVPTDTPTPSPTPSPTPEPAVIQITSPTLGPGQNELIIPEIQKNGLSVSGVAEPEREISLVIAAGDRQVEHTVFSNAQGMYIALFTAQEFAAFDGIGATILTAYYAQAPASFGASLPIRYQTSRENGAKLVEIRFSHRMNELRIQGFINLAGLHVTLQTPQGQVLAQTDSGEDGSFGFLLEDALHNGRPENETLQLLLGDDVLHPENLKVGDVKQETLLPFTSSLQGGEPLLLGICLSVICSVLLLACFRSRRKGRREPGDAGKPSQGGENRG